MSLNTLQFLQAILPTEGYKCATTFGSDGKPRGNKFFLTTEELAEALTTRDALGETVYHACAVYKVPENDPPGTPRNERRLGRTHHNALSAKAFWLDVDAGEDKPYPDVFAAAEAAAAFCSGAGLPTPLYVASGAGIHMYWPLTESVPAATWLQYANGLKVLCTKLGLETDPTRTADISSILRPPGTRNRKRGEVLVTCGPMAGPYPLHTFEVFTAHATQKTKKKQKPTENSLVAKALQVVHDNTPSYTQPIVEHCAQLARFRDTQGNVPEPDWYAALGVLAATADGEQFAHDWSRGYAGYSERETAERLERQKEFGPTTCERFASLNPKGCEGCPLRGRITSPIQLGKPKAAPEQLPPVAAPNPFVEDGPLYAPRDFIWRGDSLYFQSESSNGNVSYDLICQYGLSLHSVQVGEIQNDRFSLLFKLKLPNESRKDIIIRSKDFFSSQGISIMADSGAIIHEADLFKRYVRNAVDNWNKENKLEKRYDQFGWKDNESAFLYGKHLYTANNTHPVIGSHEVQQRSQWLQPTPKGSLERWSDAANSLFAKGCEAQSFALLCSFAAPLMRFHASEEGGAIVSLLSKGSGKGKSTALEACASVWGKVKGLSITNIDTKVAKSLTLGVLGNLPVIYDELTNRDPTIIKEFVLVFTNGRDKMRGTSDGEIKHTQANWQTLLISASNMSLVDLLTTKGVDAPAFRVLEFPTSLPEGLHSKGDSLRKELEANAGYAGDAYMRYLLQPAVLDFVKKALPQWTQEIWQQTKLQSHHRFWVRTLASVAVASKIVEQMGILSFSPQRILDWAMEQVGARRHDATVTANKQHATSIVAEYLNEHVSCMLIMPGPYKPRATLQPLMKNIHKLLIRYEVSNNRILISRSHFFEWLQKNEVGPRELIAELEERNVVTRARAWATLGAGTDIAGGQIECVEINGQHPALSGTLAPVHAISEELVEQRRKAEALAASLPRQQDVPKA